MSDQYEEQAVAEGAAWAAKAVDTFMREMGVVPNVVESARAAVRQFENDAGFEGDLETQIWQLLVSIDDLRTTKGLSWQETFTSGDASSRSLEPSTIVRALSALCQQEGIDFEEQLHTIWLDVENLRPGRGESWPDLSVRSAPSP